MKATESCCCTWLRRWPERRNAFLPHGASRELHHPGCVTSCIFAAATGGLRSSPSLLNRVRIAASTTAELQLAVSVLAPDRAGPKLWEKGQPGAAMPRSSFPTRFGGFVALRSRVALLAPAHSVLSDGASNRAGAVAGVSVDLPPDAA